MWPGLYAEIQRETRDVSRSRCGHSRDGEQFVHLCRDTGLARLRCFRGLTAPPRLSQEMAESRPGSAHTGPSPSMGDRSPETAHRRRQRTLTLPHPQQHAALPLAVFDDMPRFDIRCPVVVGLCADPVNLPV